MKETNFIRARSPEQKCFRLSEIKATTARLFAEFPYHEITLTMIASALGWSRGNLYKYVSTKEEIFLALYKDAFEALVEDLERTITPTTAIEVETFARAVAKVSVAHGTYFLYQGLLAQVIEANVSFERLVAFKRFMIDLLARLDAVFARCVPDASSKELYDLSHAYRYVAAGIYSALNCGNLTREATREAGMKILSVSLEADLADFLRRFLSTYV